MTDITKAIAAAREALAKRDELAHRGNRLRAEERANWECAQHLRDLLAALDAQQPVLYVKAEQLADPRVSGMNAVRKEHQDHVRGLHTVPLFLAPQAPPVEWFERWIRNNYQNHPNIASLCDAMLAAALAANKENGND